MKLCEKLYELRRAAGLSQEELAERLNVSRQAVSKWENGAAQPELSKLVELSRLYGVSVDELLSLEEAEKGDAKAASSVDSSTLPRPRLRRIPLPRRRRFAGKSSFSARRRSASPSPSVWHSTITTASSSSSGRSALCNHRS